MIPYRIPDGGVGAGSHHWLAWCVPWPSQVQPGGPFVGVGGIVILFRLPRIVPHVPGMVGPSAVVPRLKSRPWVRSGPRLSVTGWPSVVMETLRSPGDPC